MNDMEQMIYYMVGMQSKHGLHTVTLYDKPEKINYALAEDHT